MIGIFTKIRLTCVELLPQIVTYFHFHQASKCCVSWTNISKHQFYYINIHHKNCQVGVRNLSTMMAPPPPLCKINNVNMQHNLSQTLTTLMLVSLHQWNIYILGNATPPPPCNEKSLKKKQDLRGPIWRKKLSIQSIN